jgi:hypothetical protein
MAKAIPLNRPTMYTKTLYKVRMMKAPLLMVLDLWNGAGDRWNMVEGESSGAPGGVVAAVGANDVARFSLCEKSASGLNGGALVPKE